MMQNPALKGGLGVLGAIASIKLASSLAKMAGGKQNAPGLQFFMSFHLLELDKNITFSGCALPPNPNVFPQFFANKQKLWLFRSALLYSFQPAAFLICWIFMP